MAPAPAIALNFPVHASATNPPNTGIMFNVPGKSKDYLDFTSTNNSLEFSRSSVSNKPANTGIMFNVPERKSQSIRKYRYQQ